MSHRTTARRQAMQESRDIARRQQMSNGKMRVPMATADDKRQRVDNLIKKYKGAN